MTALVHIALLLVGGVLLGHSLTERAFDQRSRRQSMTQHWLNQQLKELEVRQHADTLFQDTRQQATTHLAQRPTPFVING